MDGFCAEDFNKKGYIFYSRAIRINGNPAMSFINNNDNKTKSKSQLNSTLQIN